MVATTHHFVDFVPAHKILTMQDLDAEEARKQAASLSAKTMELGKTLLGKTSAGEQVNGEEMEDKKEKGEGTEVQTSNAPTSAVAEAKSV
jgi:hypothetical protein